MSIKDILPWKRKKDSVPVRREQGDDALESLRRDLNSLVDEFLTPLAGRRPGVGGFAGMPAGAYVPRVDLTENDKEVVVSIELPGVDEKDVDLTLDGRNLVVRGEKKEEDESREGDTYRYERTYGSFQRVVPLPEGLDEDKAGARFRKGVLTVRIPRSTESRNRRKKVVVES